MSACCPCDGGRPRRNLRICYEVRVELLFLPEPIRERGERERERSHTHTHTQSIVEASMG